MRRLRRALLGVFCGIVTLVTGLASATTSAQAAVPDRWGFAFVDVFSGVPTLAHQAGSWSSASTVTVSSGATGQVKVAFPGIATSGGVAHVTAVSPNAEWCQLQTWAPSGPDEIALVQCYKYGGAPAFVPFTIVFEQSSGLLPAPQALGYVHFNGSSVATQFNSAGAANTVAAGGVGTWTVTLPGLGSTGPEGGLQVTAVDRAKPARCKVGGWSSAAGAQTVKVICHDATSTPYRTGWTLSYQRQRAITGAAAPPKHFGYTLDTAPTTAGPYAPAPAGINFNSQGATNTIKNSAPGREVTFPKVGYLRDHVQVTAFGPGPEYCNLLKVWATPPNDAVVGGVKCYNALALTPQRFFASYTSEK
ncbi:hypothetical protein [Streptosporangium carneum]|uniref:Uncharacterized protein n=1 Tax=Streptosporangium carneum TaxID=47481 RepID=A0A9W6I4L3_9ACTN|nr:hypothetical protein [Streptosporangium carneum]GLK11114.1 hypothetical protein GCM10017600_45200 [Streptosporangium carneum]